MRLSSISKHISLIVASVAVSIITAALLISAAVSDVSANVHRWTNLDHHDYYVGSAPSRSYITALSDGGYMIFECDANNDSYLVEYYDADLELKSTKEVPLELVTFGGFYSDANGYYILTAQSNADESADVECYRVTKYDKSWNRKGSVGLKNCNTISAFTRGNASMASSGNYLFVHTCHTMYKTSDGLNHQANLSMVIDTSTMSMVGYRSGISNVSTGYTSHSFNQFVKISDGYVYTADHGDAYPRGLMVARYRKTLANGALGSVDHYEPITFSGEDGYNYTGASIGGMEVSGTKVIAVGNSIDQSNFATGLPRNIFVTVTDFSSGTSSIKWLTSDAGGDVDYTTPFLVKVSDNSFAVIWSSGERVYYAFIDSNGNLQGTVRSATGMLSDCQPVVSGGRILWYTYDTYNTNFYAINISDKSFSSLSPVDINHAAISYTFTQTYTGEEICPEFDITYDGKTLVKGKDYQVTFADNVDYGYATATIEGIGSFNGTVSKQFYVDRADISVSATVDPVADLTFTGKTVTPDVVVRFNGKILEYNTDYTVTVDSNYTVGEKELNIYGNGNFKGRITLKFNIVPADMNDLTYSTIADWTYSGSAISPTYTVKNGSRTLTKGTDYTAVLSDNINAGTGKITLTGTGNYTGTKVLEFNILPASASSFTLSAATSATYTGSVIEPAVTVSFKNVARTAGVDYEVSYTDNVNAGTATITVTGIGNFTGTRTRTFTISAKSISSATISAIADQTYTGSQIKPSITVKDGSKKLTLNTDYTVSYSNNTNVGTATVTVTGKGNYTGTRSVNFNIVSSTIPTITVGSIGNKTYTGSAIKPAVTVTSGSTTLVSGTDYTVAYKNNTNVGTATVTVTGIGTYAGASAETTFKIVAKSIYSATVSSIADQIYTGAAIKPDVTVKVGSKTLTSGTDYTVSYSNNINVGTATVTITGKGNYNDSCSTTFRIVSSSAPVLTVSPISAQTYTGYVIRPSVTVKSGSTVLTEGTHYTVSYGNNVYAGTATVTVTGIGTYQGSYADATFTIKPKSVSGLTLSNVSASTYTGSEITPNVIVKDGSITLRRNFDYTVTYSDNVNVGEAYVNVVGIGSYTGTKSTPFSILARSVSMTTVSSISDQTYTGSAIKPSVTVKDGSNTLTLGTDYTVSYSGNKNVGTATVTITGQGNYSSTRTVTFKIVAKSISSATISSIADQTYTGSAITPDVTVKVGSKTLTSGTDYTVTYSNNTNAGTATVTVTGKGNYTGTASTTFKIVQSSTPTPDPDPEPEVLTYTWKSSGGKWYLYNNYGRKVTGFAKVSGTWYYMNSSGVMLTGWQQIEGIWYYFASSGAMKTGWQKISKVWYYFNGEGQMLTGFQEIGGSVYYLKSSGAMVTGWQQIEGIWYYFASSGAMKTGWQQISKVWYYFNADGQMLTGFQEIGGSVYYLKSSGAMATKWLKIDGKWYWFGTSGSMSRSTSVKISGKTYKFDADGICLNP